MCNHWTNEHAFFYTGNTTNVTSATSPPFASQRCRCGRLTWGEAKALALQALYDAKERRQKEREAEAEYWKDL